VLVRIAVHEGVVTVEVADDGVGMSGSTRRSGVANLAERAAGRGGALDVQSGSGGTRLVWTANAE
jgi:signal transduction histidine kinase